jgi:hypothetical protein
MTKSRLLARIEKLEAIPLPAPDPEADPRDRQAWQALCGDATGSELVREFATIIDSGGWAPTDLVHRIDARIVELGFADSFEGAGERVNRRKHADEQRAPVVLKLKDNGNKSKGV